MPMLFDQLLRPEGCITDPEIRVSKSALDDHVAVSVGNAAHNTFLIISPRMADRLGWALLSANQRRDMPLDGEPDRETGEE